MPKCEAGEGGVVVAGGDNPADDCVMKQGFTVRFQQRTEEVEPEVPAPLEVRSPERPARSQGVRMPAPAPAPAPVEAQAPAPVSADAAPAPAVAETPVSEPALTPVTEQAHTTEPSVLSADDFTKVMGAAGGGSAGLIGLVILVVGGAAGWKFWTKFSEQKHEQRMKQMDIDAQEKGLGNAQPIPCQSVAKAQTEAIASLKAQVEEVQAKVNKVEKKTSAISADFDAEELEERLVKIEKALKAKKAGV